MPREGDGLSLPHGRTPLAWVRPRGEEQVREILTWATRTRTPLYPWGGGTRWLAAFRPFEGGVGLDLGRLTQVAELDAANLTVTVGAGLTHRALASLLDEHGFFFPPAPAGPGRATIGGQVASGEAGSAEYGYGPIRSHVLGLRALFPDGSGGPFGGKQVKNVSGYNLSRLLCGSWGALGVITEVTLKVAPRPERSLIGTYAGTSEQILTLAEKVRMGGHGARALDVFFGSATKPFLPRPEVGGDRGPDSRMVLVVRLDGTAEDVARQATWLTEAARKEGVAPGSVETASAEESEPVPDLAIGSALWNVSVLPTRLGELLRRLVSSDNGLLGGAAQAGNGRVRLWLKPEEAIPSEGLRRAVAAASGWLAPEDAALDGAPGEARPRSAGLEVVWGRLKARLDPALVLCPAGRIGGEPAR